jgi:hypothetical protein
MLCCTYPVFPHIPPLLHPKPDLQIRLQQLNMHMSQEMRAQSRNGRKQQVKADLTESEVRKRRHKDVNTFKFLVLEAFIGVCGIKFYIIKPLKPKFV